MAGARMVRQLPWLAAMRLKVATWKSGFFWRRTDDEHSTCALRPTECSAEVFNGRHYVLRQCTDETSARGADYATSACR